MSEFTRPFVSSHVETPTIEDVQTCPGSRHGVHADWLDLACDVCHVAIFAQPGAPSTCTRCVRDEDGSPPPAAPAMPIPAIVEDVVPEPYIGSRRYVEDVARGLTDTALIVHIGHPGLSEVTAPRNVIEDVYSAELLRRIAERQCAAQLPTMSDDALALVIEGADDIEDPFDFGPAAPLILNAAAAELDRRMQLRGTTSHAA